MWYLHLYNNKINRMMKLLILVVLSFLVSQCATIPNPSLIPNSGNMLPPPAYLSLNLPQAGGLKPYNDFLSQTFANLYNFILQDFPQIIDYGILAVYSQVVAGTNYYFYFIDDNNCNIGVQVFVSLSGNLNLAAYDAFPCSFVSPGRYVVETNPSGTQYQNAVNNALSQNSLLFRSDLVLTQTQLFVGTYNLTFRNYVQPQNFIPWNPLNGLGPVSPSYSDITYNNSAIQIPLTLVIAQFPQVTNYQVVGIQTAIFGGNIYYKVGLQNNNQQIVNYAAYLITVGNSGNIVVTQQCWINGVILSDFWQIGSINANIATLYPQLAGFTITTITSITPNQEGMNITFSNGNQQYTLTYSVSNGVPQTSIV